MRIQFMQPFLIAMMMGSLVYMLGGAAQEIQRRLEVAGLTVVDDNGNARITMDTTKDGAEVVFFFKNGEPAGRFAVTKTGVEVSFEGEKKEKVRMEVKGDSAFIDLT